jgi:hypothetical protein
MSTTKITGSHNEVTIVHSNPAETPANPLSGQAVVSATKTPGNPNGNVSGQVTGTSVLVKNPA